MAEKWGFREAARHLGCSWRFAQKEADGGALASCVLPESEWVKEQVLMYVKHVEKTPFGWKHTHTTEELSVYEKDEPALGVKKGDPRLVDKVLDADAVRAISPEQFQAMIKGVAE